jgi:HK97 family phage portal protein
MNILRRLFGRTEEKASATGQAIAYWTSGQPVYSDRNYETFAREAYVRNAIAHRCISLIAQAGASVPWLLNDRSGKEIESHPVLDLLARPNPLTPGAPFFEAVYAFYLIAGNAYVEGVGPGGKRPPRELYPLRPDRMKVVPGADAMPVRYEYEANGITARFDVDRVTGRSPILHWKSFNPTNDFYGMSAVDPASYAIDRHTEAANHNTAVLQNGATPSGAMVFKPVTVDGQATTASREIIELAEQRITERYAGARNAGRPMVLGGNVDWLTFGMTMEQLQLNESKLDAAQDICIAFGVPIALMLPGQSTYNNVREAKLALYLETVLPMVEKFRDHLNAWLLPGFGEGLHLDLNLDEIEALAPLREIRQEQTAKLYAAGLITLDEGREALQFQPADTTQRAELLAAKTAQAEAQRAAAFNVDAHSNLFDDAALRKARAAQLALHGVYPEAQELAAEPEQVDPITFGDGDASDEPQGDEGAR